MRCDECEHFKQGESSLITIKADGSKIPKREGRCQDTVMKMRVLAEYDTCPSPGRSIGNAIRNAVHDT